MSANTEQKMKPWAVMSPHGIEYVGLCTDEVHAWHIALGWPPDEEIAQLKKQGWWASDAAVTINHQPPSPRHADHVPDATKMIETAAPSGERERFESWWRSVQLMTFPKEYDIERLQDWGSAYKPKSLEAWQARAALSAGDAVDAQRLDFIEKYARCDPKMDGQHVWWPTSFNTAQLLKGPTLREALDNAIRARKDNT